MAFAKRFINLKFQLGEGGFGGGADTVELKGYRCSLDISRAGGIQLAEANIRIFGLPLETMNKLTVLQVYAYAQTRKNTVTVSASDELNGEGVCFEGTIREAWADASSPPDVVFAITAFANLHDAGKTPSPTSYSGSVDVATVISGLANQMGYGFENSGVSAKIDSPYLPGTFKEQLRRVAQAADINLYVDDVQRSVAIWPRGQARDGQMIKISRDTGMVSYPSFTQYGLQVTTLYNPSLNFGRKVQIESDLTAATGTWVIASVAHNLEADVPGGVWFTTVDCTLDGHILPKLGR